MTGSTSSLRAWEPTGSEDGASRAIEAHRPERTRLYLITVVLVAVLVVGGWAVGRATATAHASTPGQAPTAVGSSRSCARTCTAAYRVIAEALPHDQGALARAILRTRDFDYLQLDHALHVPTIAQIRAQWRRYCRARYPGDPRDAAVCIRMIDSWTPSPFPPSPGWASS